MSSESCSLSFGHFDSLSFCFLGFLSKLVHSSFAWGWEKLEIQGGVLFVIFNYIFIKKAV